jgi:hypothetical protein
VTKPGTPGTPAGYDPGWGWGYDGFYGYEGWYPFLFDMGIYYVPMSYDLRGAAGGSTTPSYATPAPGAIKLKVTPKDAEVYTDLTYMGRVKEFDGSLQHLTLRAGTHTIEIRSEGYETLRFEVRIMPGRTVTYQGTLRPTVPK